MNKALAEMTNWVKNAVATANETKTVNEAIERDLFETYETYETYLSSVTSGLSRRRTSK